MRVLIVEDDKAVAGFLRKSFEAEHYEVETASDGRQALALLSGAQYDLLVLDLNLPEMDGLEVLRSVRAHNGEMPVLALTSRREVEARVKALDLGADDYLPKPFAFSELAARARALLRRRGTPMDVVLTVEDLEFNRVGRQVKRGDRIIELTPKELALLEYLMQNAGQCVTRAMILDHVWKLAPDSMTNVVDVYINYLRKKVDDGYAIPLIHTIRGSGYWIGRKDAAQDSGVPDGEGTEQGSVHDQSKSHPA
jgi:DNA-binding response OmpR family regulator